jgi:tetratricopeptide (TPR) repeat protein
MAGIAGAVYKAPVRTVNRVLTTVLAGSLSLAVLQVPPAMAAGPAAEQADLKEAERLYKQGKTKFETADYEEALALWKQAYALLPESADTQVIRNALVYNISEAQVKAYEINRNVTHLRKAKLLLDDYLARHRQLYGDDENAVKERSDARDRLREVERMIAEAEARGEQATPIAGAGETEATEAVPTEPQQQQPEKKPERPLSPEEQAERDRIELIKTDPVMRAKYQKATGLMVGGAVMGGIGIVLLAVGGLSAMAIPNCNISGLAANCERNLLVAALVTGIPGLGLTAGGGAMLGIGLKRRSVLKDPTKPLPAGVGRTTTQPTPTEPAPYPAPGPAPEEDGAPDEAVPAPEQPSAFLQPMFLRDGGGATFTVRF